MNLDRVLGGTAIAAVPAAFVALFWLRETTPGGEAAPLADRGGGPVPAAAAATPRARLAAARPVGSAPAAAGSGEPSSTAAASAAGVAAPPAEGGVVTRPPRARPGPTKTPLEPPRLAVELPLAEDDLGVVPLPDAPTNAPAPGAAPALAGAAERHGPCGGVLVRVITTSAAPAWSFATIASGPGLPAALRRVGDPVGPFRVDAIEWDRVWLLGGGVRCAATLHAGLREARAVAPPDPGGRALLAAADDAPPVWQVPAEIARGIQRRSATELLLDPRAVAGIYARGADLLAGTRLDPVREGGEVVGVALGSIAPDSLLDRLGVESGDILRALDREPVATLDGVAAALVAARSRGALIVRLARGGAEFDVELLERGLATE